MAKCRKKRRFTGDRPREPVFRIVAAYVTGNALPQDRLGTLIATMHAAAAKLQHASPRAKADGKSRKATSEDVAQVEIRSSGRPDEVKRLEYGRLYRTMRRHLRRMGSDPEAYRLKWGLPSDYLMTCCAFSKRRAAIARQFHPSHVSRT